MAFIPKTFRGFMRAIGKPLPTVNSVAKAASKGPPGPLRAAADDAAWEMVRWTLVALAIVGGMIAVIVVAAGALSLARSTDPPPAGEISPGSTVDPPQLVQERERRRRRPRRRAPSAPPESPPESQPEPATATPERPKP